jgi:hypothetical protein
VPTFAELLRAIAFSGVEEEVSTVTRFLSSSRVVAAEAEAEPGLIQLADGSVWLVNPDLTLTRVAGGGGGGSVSVTDGSTTVDPASELDFSGATVTDEGGGAAGIAVGGSMPGLLVTVNGTVKDLAVPSGTPCLLLDPSAQPWAEGATYSLEIVGGDNNESVVVTSEDPPRKFSSCYVAAPVSGVTEPTWPTDPGVTVDDGEIPWEGGSYTTWTADTTYDGSVSVLSGGQLYSGIGTSGGSEPDFAGAPNYGDTVTDNDITWSNVGAVSTWQPSHAYPWIIRPDGQAFPDPVLPTSPDGIVFSFNATIPPTHVATGPEPDWASVPVDSSQQLIGSGIVWEEQPSIAESLLVTGITAPDGPAVLVIANAAAPDSVATVTLVDEANAPADIASADGNRFNAAGTDLQLFASSTRELTEATVPYANSQWQPPLTGT